MSRLLKARADLPDLVKSTFAKALSAGDLHYFATQVTILPVHGIPFQLRFSPALANKPKGPPPDPSQPRKLFDPFANPPASLFVSDLGPAHFLVLNKFAVVPEHFILATKDYKLQTHILEEDDLQATLACIEAYEEDEVREGAFSQNDKSQSEGGLFAFFNGGDHSGASQPHRHIQLLPVSRMRDGLDEGSSWDVLANNLDTLQDAPFVTFSEPISITMPPSDLHAVYLRLYQQACRAVRQHTGTNLTTPAVNTSDDEIPTSGEAKISYNMAMTKKTLVVCPRITESSKIRNRQDGGDQETLGSLALNGTLLAGTALVKNKSEWEALKKDPEGLKDVLEAIGIPRDGFMENNTDNTTKL